MVKDYATMPGMEPSRLEQQIRFIVEIDKLKTIYRRTYLITDRRHENTAEHSWHISVMAMILAEHSNAPIDVMRVLKMTLIHDIVEIDAGDTYIYADQTGKIERERIAAERIFGLLPPEQEREFRSLWEEFESAATPEARFASALDRFIPQLHNYHTQGRSWQEHGISAALVLGRNEEMSSGSVVLWEWTQTLIERAVEEGLLPRK